MTITDPTTNTTIVEALGYGPSHYISSIDGTTFAGPKSLDTLLGSVIISSDGSIAYDDEGTTTSHPPGGVDQIEFSFNIEISLGAIVVDERQVTVKLSGISTSVVAPLAPTPPAISNETTDSFDVTTSANPDDGGSAILFRVVSIMPEDEYLVGDYGNAVYLNDFSASESRTINASNYPSVSSAGRHVVRDKAVNSADDNNGHGPYSTTSVAILTAPANSPTFTTQPTLTTGPFTVGDSITLNEGAATGDNAVTLTLEKFTLNGVDKSADIVSNVWDSTGEASGNVSYCVRATDDVTSAFSMSNTITVPLADVVVGGVKSQVLALFGTSGRTSSNTLQTLTSGNAPAGVSVSANIVNINGDDVILSDFLIHDKTITVKGDNYTQSQCVITEGPYLASFSTRKLVDIYGYVSNFTIEDCDFSGVQGYGAGLSSAVYQRTPTHAGAGGTIRRNRFKWFSQDTVKTGGGVLGEENVFYAQSNVATTPSGRWSSGTTYAMGEVVKHTTSEKHYVSLVVNNVGNALSDATRWEYYDPHYDFVTTHQNVYPSTFRRNLFLLDNQDTLIPAGDRSFAVGAVNAFRVVRDSNTTIAFAALTLQDNVIKGFNTYYAGVPIQANSFVKNLPSGTPQPAWVNPTISGNYIDENGRGEYAHSSTASSVTWTANYDFTSNATITP